MRKVNHERRSDGQLQFLIIECNLSSCPKAETKPYQVLYITSYAMKGWAWCSTVPSYVRFEQFMPTSIPFSKPNHGIRIPYLLVTWVCAVIVPCHEITTMSTWDNPYYFTALS